MFIRIIACLPTALFLLSVAEAQQPLKVPRVGLLISASSAATAPL